MSKWKDRFIRLADEVSTWSKDPSTKVGAVIVDNQNRIISVGYNGFPCGVSDEYSILNDRERKYLRVIHAEENAILNSNSKVKGCNIFVTHHPCSHCSAIIIQSGIRKVFTRETNEGLKERFKESFKESETMFKEANIEIEILEK